VAAKAPEVAPAVGRALTHRWEVSPSDSFDPFLEPHGEGVALAVVVSKSVPVPFLRFEIVYCEKVNWENVGYPGGIPDVPIAANVVDFGAKGDAVTDDHGAITDSSPYLSVRSQRSSQNERLDLKRGDRKIAHQTTGRQRWPHQSFQELQEFVGEVRT
jgi:hypothetical protein